MNSVATTNSKEEETYTNNIFMVVDPNTSFTVRVQGFMNRIKAAFYILAFGSFTYPKSGFHIWKDLVKDKGE